MSINPYDKGDLITLWAEFKDKAGAAADPTTVTLKTRAPDGTIAVRSPLTNPSTGRYEYDLSLTGLDAQTGRWRYQFSGTGTVQAVEVHEFVVRTSEFD